MRASRTTRAKKRRHDSASALKSVITDAFSHGEISQVAAIVLIRVFHLEAA